MDEYIDREALLEEIDAAMNADGMGFVVGTTLKRYLKRQKVADVTPVVRCKDCEFSHMDGWFCGGVGMMPEHITLPESFCDHGERKGGAEDGT